MNNHIVLQVKRLSRIALVVGLNGLLLLAVGLLLQPAGSAQAWSLFQPAVDAAPLLSLRYVAVEGTDAGNDCSLSVNPCATVQRAVDVAAPGDEIRVAAGTYTSVQVRQGITQVVYISQSVTIRGGYTTTNWVTSDPETKATILDAQGQGRVIVIPYAQATLAGLRITGGDTRSFPDLYGGITGRVGAGIYIDYSPRVVVSSCQIYSNVAAYFGAGLFASSSGITVTNSRIFSNILLPASSSAGGGVYAEGGIVVVDNSFVYANSAYYGGGLALGERSWQIWLRGNHIYSNHAFYRGGGLSLVSTLPSDADVLIASTVFSQNVADYQGGGAFLGRPSALVTGSLFISNTAAAEGGGVYVFHDADTLSYNTFMSNTADVGGGVALTGAASKLRGNQISHNHGNLGGGVGIWESQAVTLTANVIEKNTANFGGGVLLYDTPADFTDNILAQNAASIRGGAMDVVGSSVQLARNIITGNSSSDGAGVYLWPPSNATLTNNVLADHDGAALVVNSSTAHLLHNTLTRNGIAVFMSALSSIDGVADMTNTLLANNSFAIYASAGNTVTLNGVLWFNNSTNTSGPGSLSITHELTGNPHFAADGYHLLANSLALDAGVMSSVPDDIDGDSRPSGPAVDIGADEWQHSATLDLSITQQVLPVLAYPNDDITYTVAYRNADSVATGVVISAEMPSGLTNLNIVSSGAVLTSVLGMTYTWQVADLVPGAVGLITITASVMPGLAPQVLTSTVSITSSQSDSNPANNTADTVLTIANRAPLANAGSDQSALVNAASALDGSASSDPDGHLPLAYEWQQTGGVPIMLSSNTVSRPTFIAPSVPSILRFGLNVTDSFGLRSTAAATVMVTVTDRPVTNLSVANDSPTILGRVTMFVATAAGSNVVYTWDFGDGIAAIGQILTHTYALSGTYTAVVTASNASGSVMATSPVTITNRAPVALAGPDQNAIVNAPVDLDGSNSYDQDGHLPLTYQWAQVGGPAVLLSSAVISRPTFAAPATPSVLTFTLRVTDTYGLASGLDTTIIHVTDEVITGLQASNSSPIKVGQLVNLTATIAAGSNVIYWWNFGDGIISAPTDLLTATHVYTHYGSFAAIISATNQSGIALGTTLVVVQPYSIYIPLMRKDS